MVDKKIEATEQSWTLAEGDIKDEARLGRRTAIAAVGAAVATALGAAFLRPNEAEACRRRTGMTDSDPNDGGNHGRTGISDSDSGDEGGCGRGGRREGGGGDRPSNDRPACSDSDSGPGSDGPGRGRHCR